MKAVKQIRGANRKSLLTRLGVIERHRPTYRRDSRDYDRDRRRRSVCPSVGYTMTATNHDYDGHSNENVKKTNAKCTVYSWAHLTSLDKFHQVGRHGLWPSWLWPSWSLFVAAMVCGHHCRTPLSVYVSLYVCVCMSVCVSVSLCECACLYLQPSCQL